MRRYQYETGCVLPHTTNGGQSHVTLTRGLLNSQPVISGWRVFPPSLPSIEMSLKRLYETGKVRDHNGTPVKVMSRAYRDRCVHEWEATYRIRSWNFLCPKCGGCRR